MSVLLLERLHLIPQLHLLGQYRPGNGREENGRLHMLDWIGNTHRRNGRLVGHFKGFPIGMPVAASFDQHLAGLRRQPGIDEVIGRGRIGLAGVEQGEPAEPSL
jgi:hypothetical protein